MICKDCEKDLPLSKFSPVQSRYKDKRGNVKVYFNLRKTCNACTWDISKGYQKKDKNEFAGIY